MFYRFLLVLLFVGCSDTALTDKQERTCVTVCQEKSKTACVDCWTALGYEATGNVEEK